MIIYKVINLVDRKYYIGYEPVVSKNLDPMNLFNSVGSNGIAPMSNVAKEVLYKNLTNDEVKQILGNIVRVNKYDEFFLGVKINETNNSQEETTSEPIKTETIVKKSKVVLDK